MSENERRGIPQKAPAVVAVVAASLVLSLFPPEKLIAGPRGDELFALCLLAGALTLASRGLRLSVGSWVRTTYSILRGLAFGLEFAYGLLGLVVLWQWFDNPGNGKLEPLFAILGLATGLMEGARRELNREIAQKEC